MSIGSLAQAKTPSLNSLSADSMAEICFDNSSEASLRDFEREDNCFSEVSTLPFMAFPFSDGQVRFRLIVSKSSRQAASLCLWSNLAERFASRQTLETNPGRGRTPTWIEIERV